MSRTGGGASAATTAAARGSPPAAASNTLRADYAVTTDPATQHQIVDQLQQVVLSEVPFIPVTESVAWFQYNTDKFTGWPAQDNPYALPAANDVPDMGQVPLHLAPKS